MKTQVAMNWLCGAALAAVYVTPGAAWAQSGPSGDQPIYARSNSAGVSPAQLASAELSPAQAVLGIGALPAAAAQSNTDSGGSKVKDDLFAGTQIFEKNATNVTEISMDPGTLGLVSGGDAKNAHNMILNVVHTYEYDKPGMYRMQDVDAFRDKLNSGDWHCSVRVRELKTGESTDVCTRHRSDDLVETAIITVEPKELTFIHTIRRGHGGSGGLFGVPLALHLEGLSSLAMLDPEALAEIQLSLHGMPDLDASALQMAIQKALPSRAALAEMQKQLKMLNGPEFQRQLKELQGPEIEKQMEQLKKQLNGLQAQRELQEQKQSQEQEKLQEQKRLQEQKPPQ